MSDALTIGEKITCACACAWAWKIFALQIYMGRPFPKDS